MKASLKPLARRAILLAGVAAAAIGAASAADRATASADPTPPPAIVQTLEETQGTRAVAPATIGWVAALVAALAGLGALLGPKALAKGAMTAARISAKAAVATGKAAYMVASDPVGSAKAAARVVKASGRSVLILAALAIFALTGVAVFDYEWIGGLLLGAGATAWAVWTAARARKALKPVPIKKEHETNAPS